MFYPWFILGNFISGCVNLHLSEQVSFYIMGSNLWMKYMMHKVWEFYVSYVYLKPCNVRGIFSQGKIGEDIPLPYQEISR